MPALQPLPETRNIKMKLLRVAKQVWHLYLLLVSEEKIMHLPEVSLFPGRERCLMRQYRVRVARKGQMLQHQTDLAGTFPDCFFKCRIRFEAKWALVVAKLNNGDYRVGRPRELLAPIRGGNRSWTRMFHGHGSGLWHPKPGLRKRKPLDLP